MEEQILDAQLVVPSSPQAMIMMLQSMNMVRLHGRNSVFFIAIGNIILFCLLMCIDTLFITKKLYLYILSTMVAFHYYV
jgi:hypothetical protein